MRNILFAIPAPDKFERNVEGLAGIIPADNPSAAIKIRADADVIDTDQLNGMVNVVNEILDVGRRPLLVELHHATVVLRTLLVAEIPNPCPALDPHLLSESSDRFLLL